ncbi:hypothetical protein Cni_G25240 [Canna indica]|uniref:Uncharacterized protein n=1 Tax=Canna indica TaxID=4628 RepID=A0AAQ3QP21_9LILI|nr:hypothetical protein Cni_G25240 [Canna indica]
MGLLDKLWDDTLAGPLPESGLGRLRKYSSFAFRSSSSSSAGATKDETAASPAAGAAWGSGSGMGDGEEQAQQEAPRVTRSIMIKRPPGWASPGSGTPPSSPAGSTPPISPFSGGGAKEWNRFRRRSMSDAHERRAVEAAGVKKTTSSSSPPFEV